MAEGAGGGHAGEGAVRPGDVVRGLEIKELVFGGGGFARLPNGIAVFVPFTAPGDMVSAEITDVRKGFCRARLLEVEKPGPGRARPVCPFFGRCGGCAYQHLDYSTEVRVKVKQLRSLLKGIGHFAEFPKPEVVALSPKRFGYRNKLRLEPFRTVQGGAGLKSISYGFCETDNSTFFQVDSCPLAADAVNDAIKNARRSLYARINASRRTPFPMTIRVDSQGRVEVFFGRAPSKLSWFHERVLGNPAYVPPGSFWQVNNAVAKSLLERAREWMEPFEGRDLIDAYAGVGTFSLAFAGLCGSRTLIESDATAMEAAKVNHGKLGLEAECIAGTTEACIGGVLGRCNPGRTVVVLDPPRTGCAPAVLEALLGHGPATVLYVSCNPSTLARDLNSLCSGGQYAPERSAVFDMFPATAHFETMVLLRKKAGSSPVSGEVL